MRATILEDRKLIYEIQHGKKELLETLIKKYYDDIYKFCYYKTGNAIISYDLTQETFLKLIKYISSYKDKGKFKSYLITIALNVCNSYFYKNNIDSKNTFENQHAHIGQNDNNFKGIENKSVILKALEKLPDKQRETIILKYYMNLRIREIAKIQNEKVPTVKSRLKQGLSKLNRFLNVEDFYE